MELLEKDIEDIIYASPWLLDERFDIEDLELYIIKMTQSEESAIKEVKCLFTPTGQLQEISIDSGWKYKFLEIADRFDKLVK